MNPETLKYHYAQRGWSYSSSVPIWEQLYFQTREDVTSEMKIVVGLKNGSYLQFYADAPPDNYTDIIKLHKSWKFFFKVIL
jgi:hypothetical protein